MKAFKLYGSFICRPGSVTAIVQMQFPRDISDPLLPLWSEMNDGRLGIFTVDRELQVNPSLYIIICDDMYTDLIGFAENDPAIKNSCSSSSFFLFKKQPPEQPLLIKA